MAESASSNDEPWIRLVRRLAEETRKRRREAGLSHCSLAVRIGYTRQYLSLAERPNKGLPSASLVQAIDDALGAEGVLVALREEADAARKACRPGAAPSTTVVEDATTTAPAPDDSPDPGEVRTSKRRELVTIAAAIAFGASLDEPVHRILAAADQPQVPTRVRPGDVQHLRSVIETLDAWDRRAGGSAVRHHALAALRWAMNMLDSSCTPAVRRELAVTTAELADSTAWYVFDAGHYESARQLSLLGLQAARESNDLGMRANVASGLARQEIYVGNWSSGLELTQLAFTAGDALTFNAIADLHTVKALAYARKRDIAECLRCIGAAADTYRPDLVSNNPPWLGYFTPAQLDRDLTFAIYDLVLGDADLGDHAARRLTLIDRFSTAFQQYPAERVRSKAIIATRLATLLYLEGEQQAAHQMTEDAISFAGQVRSARLTDDLRVLSRVLPTGSTADEYTRDLRQRLSTGLAEMT